MDPTTIEQLPSESSLPPAPAPPPPLPSQQKSPPIQILLMFFIIMIEIVLVFIGAYFLTATKTQEKPASAALAPLPKKTIPSVISIVRADAEGTGNFTTQRADSFSKVLWKYPLGYNNGFYSSEGATVADNYVFIFTANKELVALDKTTGKEIWKKAFESAISTQYPVYDKGILFVGLENNSKIGIDALTGKEVWRFTANSSNEHYKATEPHIAFDGILYLSGFNFTINAIDITNGKEKWSIKHQDIVSSFALAPKEKILFALFGATHHIAAYDISTGQQLWNFDSLAQTDAKPAYSNGKIYIATREGTIYALDALSGEIKWKSDLDKMHKLTTDTMVPNGTYHSLTIANNMLFLTSFDDYLFAYDSETGEKLWKVKTELGAGEVIHSNGIVYVANSAPQGAESYITAFSTTTHKKLFYWNTQGWPSSLVLSDGVMYFIDANNNLEALK